MAEKNSYVIVLKLSIPHAEDIFPMSHILMLFSLFSSELLYFPFIIYTVICFSKPLIQTLNQIKVDNWFNRGIN